MDSGNNFCKKIVEKNVGNFATVAVYIVKQKNYKYVSDFTNFENIGKMI